MKRALTICTAAFLFLTACGGETAVISSPPPTVEAASSFPFPLASCEVDPLPCDLTIEQLPDWLASSAQLGDEDISLLAQLPEADISLYGIYDHSKNDRLLLRSGDTLALYDLPWLTPRRFVPQLCSGDFDGDGTDELLLLAYTGSGTGVSIWSPTIFEPDGDSWTGRALTHDCWDDPASLLTCRHFEGQRATVDFDALSVTFDLPDCADPEIPLDAYIGTIVHYEVADDIISAELAVGIHQEDHIPYTCEYPLQLTAQLLYDGETFSLHALTLSEYSD